ncbi:hypothetical protein [Streptomyces litchfieldiae]|uniref:Phage protein n=1 Tax=Streptomyces litchfieldiae TaxID=3075543 RepID=A0ABU2N060_9ACTN|nr:hypothetical protein [Streptomyces sp. DSM 44938]MDT0347287.1 hypothetical protein [Streptomyces sp. DSM 44938]
MTLRDDGVGLAYRDETPRDRDRHGVLWARFDEAPGEGQPNFKAMHPHRQRHTMLHKLCHVCGGPAGRTSRGVLFLMQRPDARHTPPSWPEDVVTSKPPICRPCAALAVRHCPRLTDPVIIRSRKPRIWGVFGAFCRPYPDGRVTPFPHNDYLPYGHPTAHWFLAHQLVAELTRCTEADLDTELGG